MTPSSPEDFMREALLLAQKAELQGEVPCGAVVVLQGEVIGRGWNQVITTNDPSAHAEMMAIKDAGKRIANYRLVDCELYVTLEPCPMCSGALVHSRVKHLYFGAYDQKTGAAGTVMNLCQHPQLNHQMEVTGGLLEQECSQMLSDFFKKRREQKKQEKLARKEQSNG